MKKFLFPVFYLFFLISIVSCQSKLPVKNLTITTQDNRQLTVKTEIATTPEQLQHGYMNRKKIPDGTGMLFVFPKDQILSFWMKNTPHPLSIAYIDSKGKIRDLHDMTPYSLSPIVSRYTVRYALEVPQGWFEKNKIKEGDIIDISFLHN